MKELIITFKKDKIICESRLLYFESRFGIAEILNLSYPAGITVITVTASARKRF